MPNYEEAYAGTSGLRDDFIGTIKEATFTYDGEYNNGNTLIGRILVIAEDDGEEVVFKLSTGSGWEDDAKGAKAKREDGHDPKGFNKSCNYYLFSKGAADTEYGAVMFKTAPPWDMSVWDGEPKFHFGSITLPPVEKGGKERNVIIPVEYLGSGGGKATKAKATKADADDAAETPAQKAKRVAAEKKAAKDAPDGDEGEVGKLKAIAAEADTHEEFMERAYGELEDADALEEQIVDESWYTANHS